MKRTLSALLALTTLFLGGCGAAAPENPYRLVKAEQVYYEHESSNMGERTYTYEYAYTPEGWLAQIDEYRDGLWQTTHTLSHDAYGNVCADATTNADGTSSYGETKLTLDDRHRPIREETYDSDGALFGTTETVYDADGNIIQTVTSRIGALGEGQDWTDWVDWQYDADGNPTRQDIRWSNGSASYILYDYQDGKRIKETSYAGNGADTVTGYAEYTYDETGLVQTQQNYGKDGTPENKYITTYDEYGNVLSMDTYWRSGDGSGTGVLVRTVTNTYERIPEE